MRVISRPAPRAISGAVPRSWATTWCPLFEDPDMTLGLGSFTAFVIVPLNEQTREGCGQTAVLPGAHHATEKFLRWQRSVNDCLGPEGPGWPRLDHEVPNRCGMVYLPKPVQEQFIDADSESTPDGRRWPRPTQILMSPGDACITMYHIPHSGTRNEHGTESRKGIIFRIRNKKRQAGQGGERRHGSPGPRPDGRMAGLRGRQQSLERSKDAMCDMWDEWEGMGEIVAEQQAKEQPAALGTVG